MPRSLTVATLAAIGALLAVAPASAGDRTLAGAVTPAGTVKVKISTERSQRGTFRLYRFRFRELPLSCSDGNSRTLALRGQSKTLPHGPGRDVIGRGRSSLDEDGNRFDWIVLGLLQEPGLAAGNVRVTRVRVRDGDEVRCRTGRLPWTATR
jgi:hypothetical protein